MSKRINAATSVPHIRVGCSTVAVSWAGIKCNAYLCLYVLPANRGKIGEPTSGLEPLSCSLRVRFVPLYLSRKVAYLQAKVSAAYRHVTPNYAQVSVSVSVS